MKTSRTKFKWIFLLALPFIMSSCLHFDVQTILYADGSCERVITVQADSSDIAKARFPIPTDSSWQIDYQKQDKDDYLFTARKKFASVEEMNEEFRDSTKNGRRVVGFRSELNKSFRWFYTYWTYEETYPALIAYQALPPSDFISKEGLEFMQMNSEEKDKLFEKDSIAYKKLDEQTDSEFEKWFTEAIAEEILVAMVKIADENTINGFSAKAVKSKKEELRAALLKEEPGDINDWMDLIEMHFPQADTAKIKGPMEQTLNELLEEKFNAITEIWQDSYSHKITVPGLLMNTNSNTVEANSCTWSFDSQVFIFQDYIMKAESRMVNWWAFGITGAVVLFILILLIASAFRRKRKQ